MSGTGVKPINAAVVGLGNGGLAFARAFGAASDATRLVALCDTDPAALDTAGAEFPDVRRHAGYEDLLSDDAVELIAICTPNALHAPMALAALERGKHLIVDQPLCISIEECEQIVAAVERTGLVLSIGFQLRFDPYYVATHDLVASGGLGEAYYAESDYIHDINYAIRVHGEWRWRGLAEHNHSPMVGGASHDIDMLRWFLGEVRSVHCVATHMAIPHHPYPDFMLATLTFDAGAVAKVASHYGPVRDFVHTFYVFGTGGTVERARSPQEEHVVFGRDAARPSGFARRVVPAVKPQADLRVPLVEDVVRAIRTGGTPLIDVRSAANTTAVGLAAVESWHSGAPVEPRRF